MRNWFWIFWATVVIILAGVQFSSAAQATGTTTVVRPTAQTSLTAEQIRQMPLLTRPNRPGHFYGNTVRRINQRRYGASYRGR